MFKYFLKHLSYSAIAVASAVLGGWLIYEAGKYIGSAIDNPGHGFLISMGIAVIIGLIHYAYEQAKIEVKYSKK